MHTMKTQETVNDADQSRKMSFQSPTTSLIDEFPPRWILRDTTKAHWQVKSSTCCCTLHALKSSVKAVASSSSRHALQSLKFATRKIRPHLAIYGSYCYSFPSILTLDR